MSDESDDSPPPRPRRKIKKIVLASSGSESDDSGPATSTRKKRLRVLSDEDSESSGSSVAVRSRRKRALPKLRDSDGESDSSGWGTDHSVSTAPAGSQAAPAESSKPTSGFASDSSEGNSDKCSICLMRFTDQQVGTPQTCEHVFCLDCITEWSRNVNTCPVDRMTFTSIVVRECAGGQVLSTQPVQVVERPPSVDMLLVEDPTPCEICGSSSSEDTMLLCDGCDLGFHMECLTPPLTEIPTDQWLCRICSVRFEGYNVVRISDLDEIIPEEEDPYATPWRRLITRVRPQTDSGVGDGSLPAPRSPLDLPSTSSQSHASPAASRAPPAATRAPPAASRARPRARPRARARKRRRTRTLIIEYELEENGKFPVTKRVRRKLRKRKAKKRQPRTAARRSLVRQSVRAKLAAQRAERAAAAAQLAACAGVARARARAPAHSAVPALSLLGSPRDLLYFSDEEPESAGRGGGAVLLAARTAAGSSARAAYRQAQRKLGSCPPTAPTAHAVAAPDLLSSILESQALLHSKRTLPARSTTPPPQPPPPAERVDVRRAAGARARQAPSYGQSRGGGGWGGGYHYPPERSPAPPPRGARPQYDNGFGGAGARPDRHRDDGGFHTYERHRYDGEPFDRDRRRPFEERRSAGPAWPPYRPERPHPLPHAHAQRHSFPYSGAVDMRTGPPPERQLPIPSDKSYGPLPEPPACPLAMPPEEEDERSDSSLVIDTDKYDPTEPTDDDESAAPPAPAPAPLAPPPSLAAVESLLAGMEAPGVPAALLDSAVRQVLLEHRTMVDQVKPQHSDEGSDGDCPNFSIYSATSVHIASGALAADTPPEPLPEPPALEELFQGDGDEESPPEACPPSPPGQPAPPLDDAAKRKSDEYNERVSKRCPITTNTRNPIKIKLNTPALIRRQVSLYDEEDAEPEPEEAGDSGAEPPAEPRAEAARDSANESEDEKEKTTEPEEPEEPEGGEEVSEGGEEASEGGEEVAGERSRQPSDADGTPSPPSRPAAGGEEGEAREKMTESISETEDERSYTPCLDEHREEPDRGLDGLDTEMISEEEGNDLFSEDEHRSPPTPAIVPIAAPAPAPASAPQPSPDPAPESRPDDSAKKKKKKESKREGKERKGKKRAEVTFKKVGKGKERKYRERDGSEGGSVDSERRRKREKRKDLERYDVRTLVSERRRRTKDAFGRDVSPRERSPSPSPSPPRRASGSPSPRRVRASPSPRGARASPSPRRARASPSPRRLRASPSPRRVRGSPSPRRLRASTSPRRVRASPSPRRVRVSPSPRRVRVSPSPTPPQRSASPRVPRRRRRSTSRARRAEARRRRSGSRGRKRRRSVSAPLTKPKAKKKKRERSVSASPVTRRKSPKRKRARRRSGAGAGAGAGAGEAPPAWSPRPASPRTPPPQPAPPPPPPPRLPIEARRLRKRRDRSKQRRADVAGPSKEVFTSGDNILVSVSFKDAEGGGGLARRERRRERRRRRRAAQKDDAAPSAKPVAIIDLERSPFRELTPSPERVIVLSDDERPPAPAAPPAPAEPAAGPKTPPAHAALASAPAGPNTPPEPPDSPDAYDPYEPTASPPAPAPDPPSMTLEAAQKTNMSADEVLDRRPLEPIEKVMALLQSTRDAPPDAPPDAAQHAAAATPAPAATAAPAAALAPPAPPAAAAPAAPAAPRVQLPEPQGTKPKLFLGKPSPIKSDPIKPMQQATKISRLPLPLALPCVRGESPYSPGSSDFGDLFEPPPPHHPPHHHHHQHQHQHHAFDALFDKPPAPRAKRTRKKKGKTQVGVKLDDDNVKVLDELPNSAVEMQVKSKFLKKLNRQERVVEEVKLVLKPHYNKKHVTKEEYKHILRRTVPKICHNKTGEINPSKIQSLVEAYVKKFRKRHKLGLS